MDRYGRQARIQCRIANFRKRKMIAFLLPPIRAGPARPGFICLFLFPFYIFLLCVFHFGSVASRSDIIDMVEMTEEMLFCRPSSFALCPAGSFAARNEIRAVFSTVPSLAEHIISVVEKKRTIWSRHGRSPFQQSWKSGGGKSRPVAKHTDNHLSLNNDNIH